MFGLLKFLFYSFVAVVVGVVIGTVPFGGRTVAERIAAAYQSAPTLSGPEGLPARRVPPRVAARGAPRAKAGAPVPVPAPTPVQTAPATASSGSKAAQGPISAGAVNTPEGHSEDEKAGLEQLIASRGKGR